MVKKRGPFERIEKMMSKKRSVNAVSETPNTSSKRDRNLLNDHMLNLYRQEILTKDKCGLLLNEEENLPSTPFTEEVQIIPRSEKSKSCSKISKESESIKRRISKDLIPNPEYSSITFEDVGGLDQLLEKLLKLFSHVTDHNLFAALGVQPLRGFLLHGPPGCGKTHLARAIAGELKLPYIEIAATELVCGISGESESKIRDIFDKAIKSSPCILFIDEIDAISPKRETTERGMEKRMVAQLLKCLDELNKDDSHVMVIGATNRPDFMDPALRRGGRFDRELAIGMPDEAARLKILHILCKKLKLAPGFDMQWLAHHTPGYVGADLKSLITEAVEIGLWRIYRKYISSYFSSASKTGDSDSITLPKVTWDPNSELTLDLIQLWFKSPELKIPETEYENIYFEQQDFQTAIQNCVPYSKREGFATVPDVTWDDIGALEDVQKQLQAAILWPVKYQKLYESSNLSSTKGILLYGPKGCGKTLLAKAIANECSINFLSVKGPELLSMYLGESEKAVRQCFQRAKNSAPCVIFFDEIDALCPRRSGSNVNPAADRVVNQLLTEMDGMEDRKQVFVVGATNRLEKIDSAMLRPGRLEKVIFVNIPSSADDRVKILKRLTKNKTKPKIADDVDFDLIGKDARCENFSGADLAYLVREATTNAMDQHINSGTLSFEEIIEIKNEHFEHALKVVKPSITNEDIEYFKRSLVNRL